jgi:hypothetical protein
VAVIGAKELKRQLEMLSRESERTVTSGLRELAFHVKEAEQRHVAQNLSFVSGNTRRFITDFGIRYSGRGFMFRAEIGPRPKSAALLRWHIEQSTLRARDGRALTVDGKIAVPISVKKGKSGKVPKRQTPAELLMRRDKGRSRGFITRSGKALIERERGGRTSVAFALVERVQMPDRLDLDVVAREQFRIHAKVAFKNAMKRAAARAGVR